MPHKCVRCGTSYDDKDEAILEGCKDCGSKLFFFVKTEKELEDLEEDETVEEIEEMPEEEKEQFEKDILTSFRMKFKGKLETVRVEKSGVYDINIDALLRKRPVVVYYDRGKKYDIDLTSVFKFKDKLNR